MSVVNPLPVSRFSRMRMNRAKTVRRADGSVRFRRQEYVEVKPPLSLLDLLQKPLMQFKNQEEALRRARLREKNSLCYRKFKDVFVLRNEIRTSKKNSPLCKLVIRDSRGLELRILWHFRFCTNDGSSFCFSKRWRKIFYKKNPT